jgi:hypothetical protein
MINPALILCPFFGCMILLAARLSTFRRAPSPTSRVAELPAQGHCPSPSVPLGQLLFIQGAVKRI